MKKPKTNYKQWRWPKYLLFMLTSRRERRFLRRYCDIDIDLYGEAMRDELDARAEANLRLHKGSSAYKNTEKIEKNTLSNEYIEKKLQFLVDCGYTYQYHETDGERSLVYKKSGKRDGFYIEVHVSDTYEYCMIRTPDVPFAELARSKLATPDWRARYQNATPLVRLDMAAELLKNL